MKGRKILSVFFSICMLLCLMVAPMRQVNAADVSNQAVLDARNGVLEVTQVVTVDGVMIGYGRGTGFLVGSDSGAQTVITNYHVVNAFPYETKQLRSLVEKALGVSLASDVKVESQIRIIVKRDVYITAEIINQSESGDFAILKLEQPIYDRAPLQRADSSQVASTQPVYALGFPAAVEGAWGSSVGESIQLDAVYTAEDVTVTDGTVSKVTESIGTGAPISTIVHSATISGGNSGGPLVTADGYVIGINTYHLIAENNSAAGYNYSIEINEVTDVLKALGIEYLEAGAATVAVEETTDAAEEVAAEPVEDNSALFDELADLIDEAKEIDVTVMTEESAANFEDALDAAEDVYDNADSSAEELEGAIDDLTVAKNGLVEETGGISPVIIIVIAAVVIILIVVIVVVSANGKKKKAEAEKEQQRRAAMSMNAPKPPVNPTPAGYQQPRPPVSPMPPMSDGSEETGILNDGSSETTVLGGGASVPAATLLRKKNNERITITKQVFKLGKERRKVDYCVADNTNISRTHADIVYKNGEFYIVDNNATNGTFVNGASVAAGQERKLMNNDTIRLADEEFQFRTF